MEIEGITMNKLLLAIAVLGLALVPTNVIAKTATPRVKIVTPEIPAGLFQLEPSHASFVFSVDHLGISSYQMRFTGFEVALNFNPRNPKAANVVATVDANSLTLDNAPKGFREELLGPNWMNAGKNPKITFKSSSVVVTGSRLAKVSGELTLNGITKPLTITVVYNGGYADHPMDPGPRIGFSGFGQFKRSDFGIAAGIPPAGSKMGVGDEVAFRFQTEMKGAAK
jgi:polyisoprenoid-binding protein YceI